MTSQSYDPVAIVPSEKMAVFGEFFNSAPVARSKTVRMNR